MWALQAWAISIVSDAVFRFVCINEVPWWLCGRQIQDFAAINLPESRDTLTCPWAFMLVSFFITRCCDSPHFPSVTFWIISKHSLCISPSITCWTDLFFRVPHWRLQLRYMSATYVVYRSDLWKAGIVVFRDSCYVWCADRPSWIFHAALYYSLSAGIHGAGTILKIIW